MSANMTSFTCKISLTYAGGCYSFEEGYVELKESEKGHFVDITLSQLKQHYEVPVNDFKPIKRPGNRTAKSVQLDLAVEHNRIEYFKLTFDTTESLNKALDILLTHLFEEKNKKQVRSIINSPVQSPGYNKSQASRTMNRCTLSSTSNSSMSQQNITRSTRGESQNRQYASNSKTLDNRSQPRHTVDRNHNVSNSLSKSSPTRKRPLPENAQEEHPNKENSSIQKYSTEKYEANRQNEWDAKKAKKDEFSMDTVEVDEVKNETKSNSVWNSSNENMEVDQPAPKPLAIEQSNDLSTYYDKYAYRGMVNLGNSCYMNSSLQAVISSPDFVTTFLRTVPSDTSVLDDIPERSELLHAVSKVFRHVHATTDWEPNNIRKERQGIVTYVPRDLLRDVREASGKQIEDSMGYAVQHDAQEFLSRLLDIIHDEVEGKFPIKNPMQKKVAAEYSSSSIDEEYGKDQLTYLKDALELEPKPSSCTNPGKLFEVACYNRLVCNTCGFNCKNTDSARDLPVGISNGQPSIHDLLKMQFERHRMSWKCPKCTKEDASMSTSFHKLPECLIIVLKRYSYDETGGFNKSNTRVKVNYHLHLKELVEGSDLKNKELEPLELDTSAAEENKMEEYVPESACNSPVKPVLPLDAFSIDKGFSGNSPIKQHIYSPWKRSESQGSRSSQKDLFDGDEFVENEEDMGYTYSKPPEVTSNTSPTATNENQAMLIEENKRDGNLNMMHNYQKGGGQLTVDNSRILAQETSTDSDTQVIHEEMASSKTMLWHPMIAAKIRECRTRLGIENENEIYDIRWMPPSYKSEIPIKMNPDALTVQSVEGDGNCLFRSFAFYLFGHEEYHDLIRNQIIDFIREFPDEFKGRCDLKPYNDDFNAYLKIMSDDGTWGSQLEIWAFATMMNCTVFSHHNGTWKRFEPLFSWQEIDMAWKKKKEKVEMIPRDDIAKNGAIYIKNSHDIHFDAVINFDLEKNTSFTIQAKEEESNTFYDTSYNPAENEFSSKTQNLPPSPDLARPSTPPASISDSEDNKGDDEPIKDYVYSEVDGPVYTLSAIVNHHGSSLNHGHYTAYSFDPDRNVWLNCDDSTITEVTANNVLSRSMESGYIFVYRKRNEGDAAQFRIVK